MNRVSFRIDHNGLALVIEIEGFRRLKLTASRTEAALAIEMGADASDIGLTIHPHPTLSETVAFSAEAYDGTLTDLYIPAKRKK